MSAEIIQIRDFQNKRDIDRLYQEITAELAAIEIGSIEILEDTAPSEYVATSDYPMGGTVLGQCGPCDNATISHSDLPYVAPTDDPA